MAPGPEPARPRSPARIDPPVNGTAPAPPTDLFAPLLARPVGPSRLAGLLDGDTSDGTSSRASSPPPPSSSGGATTSSPVTSPPYWSRGSGGAAFAPNVSAESILPVGAITLRDNESGELDGAGGVRDGVGGRGRGAACWARSVEVTDWVVVNGSATNIGAFVVWNVRVETLTVRIPGRLLGAARPCHGGWRWSWS